MPHAERPVLAGRLPWRSAAGPAVGRATADQLHRQCQSQSNRLLLCSWVQDRLQNRGCLHGRTLVSTNHSFPTTRGLLQPSLNLKKSKGQLGSSHRCHGMQAPDLVVACLGFSAAALCVSNFLHSLLGWASHLSLHLAQHYLHPSAPHCCQVHLAHM